jgi:deoxyribose-phosphate aldolase
MSTTLDQQPKQVHILAKIAKFGKDRRAICIPHSLVEHCDKVFEGKQVKVTIESIL